MTVPFATCKRIARAIDLVFDSHGYCNGPASESVIPREHVEAIALEAARIAAEVQSNLDTLEIKIARAYSREAYAQRDLAERHAAANAVLLENERARSAAHEAEVCRAAVQKEKERCLRIVANTMVRGSDEGELTATYACATIEARIRSGRDQ